MEIMLPSIPVAYAPGTKETHTNMYNILVEVDCEKYQWEFFLLYIANYNLLN